MKESDEYRLGRSAAQRGEPMAKYQGLTARMNPKEALQKYPEQSFVQ